MGDLNRDPTSTYLSASSSDNRPMGGRAATPRRTSPPEDRKGGWGGDYRAGVGEEGGSEVKWGPPAPIIERWARRNAAENQPA
eukprot:scaffold28235_cov99-Isochrysis_galbana.AAC.1